MIPDKAIAGHAAGACVTTQPVGRRSEWVQPHAANHRNAVSHEILLGTSTKLADLACLSLALFAVQLPIFLARTMRDPASIWSVQVSTKHVAALAACWVVWTCVLHAVGLYEGRRVVSLRNLMLRLYTGVGLCALGTTGVLHLRNPQRSLAEPLLIFFAGSYLVMAGVRGCALLSDRWLRPHLRPTRRAIIVGVDARAEQLSHKLQRDRGFRYDIVGYVDPLPNSAEHFAGRPVLGMIPDLEHLLMREHIDEVLVALPVLSFYEEIRDVLQLCESSGVRSQYFSDLFETQVAKRRSNVGDNAERVVLHMVHNDLRHVLKRGLDLFGAVFGLIVLSPVFLAIAIAIKVTSPGPVFFSQVRYGLNKRRFPMFKFRSMVPDAEQLQVGLEHMNEAGGPVFKIKNDPRVTAIGRFLRKTSLDELPQLLNVLRGEMSLVGPRPLPMRDVGNFSQLSLVRRFSVKPGMTGLWQVSGRSDTTFDGWIKLDLYYIDHWSLLMDARILLRTLPAVVRGSGAS